MLKKTRKLLMLASAGAAVLAATPASASTLYKFYDNNGALIGQIFVDDNGVVCDRWGQTSDNYVVEYYGYYLCS